MGSHPPLTTDDELSRKKWQLNGFEAAKETEKFSYTRAAVALPVYNEYDLSSAPFEHFGYFTDWAQYDGRLEGQFENANCGRGSDIRSVDFGPYKSAIYSFLGVTGDTSAGAGQKVANAMNTLQQRELHQPIFLDPWGDLQSWRNCNYDRYQEVNLPADFSQERCAGLLGGVHKLLGEKFPHLRLTFSVGGWTLSSPFHELAKSEASIEAFGRGVVRYCTLFPMFGGVDIDWEYPNAPGDAGVPYGPEDATNFPKLVAELRRQLDAAGMRDKRISVALAGSVEKVSRIDPRALYEAGVTGFNVMTYDFFGTPWAADLAHHTNLRDNGRNHGWSVERVVEYLLARGVPAKCVYVGYAAYSRSARHAKIDSFSPLKGTYAAGASTTVGTFESGTTEYYDLLANYAENANADEHPLGGKNGFRLYTDKKADADFLYNPQSQLFLSIDTPRSVYDKGQYVREKKLGGMFCWTIDQERGLLANAALEGMGFKIKTQKIDMKPFYQPGKTPT